jgi:heterodisulfide reductase subunit C
MPKRKSFVEEISVIPGGEAIRLCIQCGTCTASCPNAAKSQSPQVLHRH